MIVVVIFLRVGSAWSFVFSYLPQRPLKEGL